MSDGPVTVLVVDRHAAEPFLLHEQIDAVDVTEYLAPLADAVPDTPPLSEPQASA